MQFDGGGRERGGLWRPDRRKHNRKFCSETTFSCRRRSAAPKILRQLARLPKRAKFLQAVICRLAPTASSGAASSAPSSPPVLLNLTPPTNFVDVTPITLLITGKFSIGSSATPCEPAAVGSALSGTGRPIDCKFFRAYKPQNTRAKLYNAKCKHTRLCFAPFICV